MSPARPTKGEPREAGRALDAEIEEHVMRRPAVWRVVRAMSGDRRELSNSIPRYSAEQTAAERMEWTLELQGHGEEYASALANIVWPRKPLVPTDADLFALIRATPEQRCRAALEAVQ